ncbi:serine hydrolase [Ornithinimicrobium sp. Y1694]|uniref:serine hydrolase n=1 Tax=Ornithinimicrobium sp. Y1694 TaxID=3418590 RepID=UPI003CEAFF83
MQTGQHVAYQEDLAVYPASFYKLFVAYSALQLVDEGELGLDDLVVGSGPCATVGSALGYAIRVSDNSCADRLAGHLGWEVVESHLRELGLEGTTFSPVDLGTHHAVGEVVTTTAEDVAMMLRLLAQGELLSEESSAVLLGELREQYFTSGLSEALGGDVIFKHKLGTLANVSHDAGIVLDGERRYVVAVTTGGWSHGAEGQAWPVLNAVGEALREYVESWR